MSRRHRPAPGQLRLLFVAALGDPPPPPVVARGRAAGPTPDGSTDLATAPR